MPGFFDSSNTAFHISRPDIFQNEIFNQHSSSRNNFHVENHSVSEDRIRDIDMSEKLLLKTKNRSNTCFTIIFTKISEAVSRNNGWKSIIRMYLGYFKVLGLGDLLNYRFDHRKKL